MAPATGVAEGAARGDAGPGEVPAGVGELRDWGLHAGKGAGGGVELGRREWRGGRGAWEAWPGGGGEGFGRREGG